MRGVWHHQDRRRRGSRELTGIVDHSRGGSSHGPLEWTWSRVGLAPCIRTGWPSAEKTSVRGCESRRWNPSKDTKTPLMTSSKTPPACSTPFTSSSSLATLQVRCVAASSKTRPVTAGARGIPSTQVRNLLRASRDRLAKRQQERLREAFTADEAHISVDVAYLHRASARGLPPSHTRPRSTPGRTLIQRLPACPIPEIARLGRTLRKWKDAFLAYFDTGGASNGSTEVINGHYRAGQTHRQRLPQPHQLPTPNAPHRRRPRRLHPHPTLKSRVRPQFLMWSCFHDGLCCDESPQDWLSSLSLGKGRPLSAA